MNIASDMVTTLTVYAPGDDGFLLSFTEHDIYRPKTHFDIHSDN